MSAHRDASGKVAEIAAQLAGLLPTAQPATLNDVLSGLRLGPRRAQQLRDHLATHPDALTSGNSDGPAVLMRLLDALAQMHPQVERARCVTCDEPRRLRHQARGGRVCGRCYAADSVEQCVRCGEAARICCRDEAGGAVCQSCRRRDTTKWEDCSVCGKRAHVYYRVDGRPLCQSCGPRPARPCSSCGRNQPVHANTPDGPLCGRCYRWVNASACESCGRLVPNRRRDPGTGARVCDTCWTPLPAECAGCGQVKPCRTNGERTGRPLCSSCRSRARPRRTCVLCGKPQRIHSRLPLGDVCTGCYTKIRRWPSHCAGCGQCRP